jgi:acid phosphatase family membrane protein YuiD
MCLRELMRLSDFLLFNPILLAALISWAIAQVSKVFVEFFTNRRWNWALVLQAGGMPSSHSAMVSSAALAIGLQLGFDQPLFALSAILAMIVIYDATGVRREAGRQAAFINSIVEEIREGKIPQQDKLKEVLGHTPGEAVIGTLLGLVIAVGVTLLVR